MLKKTITYTDFNDIERTEDFYFNLTHAELTKMQNSLAGGFQDELERISKAKDGPAIMQAFENILRMAYGQKSPDGRRLIKGEEVFREFQESNAYSQLFMELLSDEIISRNFIQGILPPDLRVKRDGTPTVNNVSSIPAPNK